MIRSCRACSSVGGRISQLQIHVPIFRTQQPHTTLSRAPCFRPLSPPTRIARGYNANKSGAQHPTAQTAPTKPKTIPGPSWLWLEPIYEPFRAYGRVQQRQPYMTQFLSALVIYLVGDMVAQSIDPQNGKSADDDASMDPQVGTKQGEEEDDKGWVQDWSDNRDWGRTARALLIGGAAAVPGYKWFLWLSNSFNYGSKVLSLTTKVTVNQLVFTPIFNTYFFGMQSFLSGSTPSEILERIKNTVPTSWVNSCKLWPAITAFSFTYIPLQYRSIFGGVIAIGWQTYLSLLNQRAAAKEVAHGHDHDSEDRSGHTDEDESECEKCAA